MTDNMKIVSSTNSCLPLVNIKKFNNPKHLLIGAIALGALAYLAKCSYDSYKVACLLKECRPKLQDPDELKRYISGIGKNTTISQANKVSFVKCLFKELKEGLEQEHLCNACGGLLEDVSNSKEEAFYLSILEALCLSKHVNSIVEFRKYYQRKALENSLSQKEIYDCISRALNYFKAAAESGDKKAATYFGELCLNECEQKSVKENFGKLYELLRYRLEEKDYEGALIFAHLCKRSPIELYIRYCYIASSVYKKLADCETTPCPSDKIKAEAAFEYYQLHHLGGKLFSNNLGKEAEKDIEAYLNKAIFLGNESAREYKNLTTSFQTFLNATLDG